MAIDYTKRPRGGSQPPRVAPDPFTLPSDYPEPAPMPIIYDRNDDHELPPNPPVSTRAALLCCAMAIILLSGLVILWWVTV